MSTNPQRRLLALIIGLALVLRPPVSAQSLSISPAPISTLDVRVTTEFGRTNTAVLADVPMSTTVNLQTGATYSFEFVGFYGATSAAGPVGGVQFAVGGTATATAIRYSCATTNDGGVVANPNTIANAVGTAVCARGDATGGMAILQGTYTVLAAGTFTIQFAQNTANAPLAAACNASSACVLAGSYLRIRQVP